jgi:putative sterol carrier protein
VQRRVVVLDGGACRTGRGLDVRPRLTLELGAVDFLKLVTDNANPVNLALSGRLGIRGDLLFAPRIPRFFRDPAG